MPYPVGPEGTAFALLDLIAKAEGRTLDPTADTAEPMTRDWILETYAACLAVTRRSAGRLAKAKLARFPVPTFALVEMEDEGIQFVPVDQDVAANEGGKGNG